MKTRIISGIFLAIIAASSLYVGSWYLFLLCAFISLVGMYELYRAAGIHEKLLGICGYVVAVAYYVCVWLGKWQLETLVFVFGLMAIMTIYVITFPKYKSQDAMLVFTGIFYVAVMLSYIYKVRVVGDGKYIVWLVFVSSWGNDTFAYFTGVLFGKHKMAPKLSPKKSVEGAVGGVTGATGHNLWIYNKRKNVRHICASCMDICNSKFYRSVVIYNRRFGCICNQEKL